jgi:type III restriction enzyme
LTRSALRDIQTERERRQTIGRGLRLCVNQNGERLRGFEVNTLTVIAMESYEQFAEKLQKDLERDSGILFGIVEHHDFAVIAASAPDGAVKPLGFEQSQALGDGLKAAESLSVAERARLVRPAGPAAVAPARRGRAAS